MRWSVLWSATTRKAPNPPGSWTKSSSDPMIIRTKTTASTVAGQCKITTTKINKKLNELLVDLEGGYRGCRKKELHVCLVFMCTRVDMWINKHFSFKIFLLNPLFEKFLDPRLRMLGFQTHISDIACDKCVPHSIYCSVSL